jgi:hypothetical protein
MAEIININSNVDNNRLLIHSRTARHIINTFNEYNDAVLTIWSHFGISTLELKILQGKSTSLFNELMSQVEIDNRM